MPAEENKNIRILFLEDQADDADLAKRAIRKGGIAFESIQVDSREDFERALQEYKPDVILSDHSLPQFNSIEALAIRKAKTPDTPFILVTGAVSDEFAAQCIKLGADDYILKSNLSRLPASIQTALEYRRIERLHNETEQTLRSQNLQLTRAHKEIDSFVYSVSHNLRAPLASVLGLISLARLTDNKSDIKKYIDMIEVSVHKLDATIKEILDYSQNERLDIQYELIDLKSLIDECLSRLQYMKGFNQTTKQISIQDSAPFFSDRFRLSIILMNLFSNSIKYRDEEKDFSLLKIKGKVTKGESILEITDNGIGISQDRLGLIFNMFYRGTERSDGAGLGLYIAKGVVEKLGGSIVVTSEPGLLTTVALIIPNAHPDSQRK